MGWGWVLAFCVVAGSGVVGIVEGRRHSGNGRGRGRGNPGKGSRTEACSAANTRGASGTGRRRHALRRQTDRGSNGHHDYR